MIDKVKFVEIRWHGRGGQGAVTSAELVAQAAISEGKYAQAFPSFGPERRGAPVQAFNRVDIKEPVRIRSDVTNPDVVIVLDPSLLDKVNVTSGLDKKGKVIINTRKTAKEIKRVLSNVGVHPTYKSLENQGYFEASIFNEEHKIGYEFYFLRSLWSFFTIQLYLLAYLVERWPRLIREIPNVIQVVTNLKKMLDSTESGFLQRARD